MTIYVVEWNPDDDVFIVALCTTLAKALEVYDEFVPAEDGYGRLFLNEYESEVRLPATARSRSRNVTCRGNTSGGGLSFSGYTRGIRWRSGGGEGKRK